MAARRLEKSGHKVTFPEASTAFALLSRGTFEVVILDLSMPKVSGDDVLTGMSHMKLLERYPVVVYSSADIDRMRDIARQYDVEWVSKGAPFAELLAAIETALSKRAGQQPDGG